MIYAKQQEWKAIPPDGFFEGTFLWIALGLFIFPFVRSLKLGKILEIERDVQKAQEQVTELKEDTRQQLGILFNSINTISNVNSTVNKIYFVQGSVQTTKPSDEGQLEGPPAAITPPSDLKPQPELIHKQHTADQLKILNTLWVKQVNKYGTINPRFSLKLEAKIPSFPEFDSFYKAVEGLKQEDLVKKEADGHVWLTKAGLKYCLKRYEEFPSDMWFDQEPINEEKLGNLKHALEKL